MSRDMLLTGCGKSASATPDSPDDISGLLLWLKADALSLNDGDPIASWTDSSGNNNHATQSTADNKPTFQTNEQNGKPVVRFDGSLTDPDRLDLTTDLDLEPDWTIFAVAKCTNAAADRRLLTKPASSDYALVFVGVPGGSGFLSQGPQYGETTSDNDAYTANTTILVCIRCDSGSVSYFANGVDVSNDGTANNDVISVDAIGATASTFAGDVAEIIIYDSALSVANRQAIENYLNTKYAIY